MAHYRGAAMPSLADLTRRTWIDHTCDVNASAETLYALLSDVDGWPDWTPGLRAIERRNQGFVGSGARFTMHLEHPKLGVLKLPTVMYENQPLRMVWGGGGVGSVIRHSFELLPIDAGRTRLRHVEYATGALALATLPFEKFAHDHDYRWSETIRTRFEHKA